VTQELDVGALSRRYGPMVLRRCRRLLRDDEEALDACQDVFLRVFQRRDRLDAQYASSLLYRIATNVCLNRIRDRARRTEDAHAGGLDAIAHLEEPGARSHARLLLNWLFKRHPESTRTMAVLHYLDGLTLEQVASECGMSVSGVRKRLNRLRQDVTR